MYELPPILTGSAASQTAALRDYLVRLAQSLNEAGAAPTQSALSLKLSADGRRIFSSGGEAAGDIEAVRKNAAALRQLILKTADDLETQLESSAEDGRIYADGQIEALGESYIKRSEFGAFTENVESQIASTARGVVESYDYSSLIEAQQGSLSLLQSYLTELNGQIRRGIVTDPSTNEEVTGIAISQSLQFTGEIVRQEDGVDYYRLSSGQTFGLYTATGWQFWIDGCKKGWYDSVEGLLRIARLSVEEALHIGGQWQISGLDGLGIKYTGD